MAAGSLGYPVTMERIFYFLMAGVLIVALGIAIVVGGWMWILPVISAAIIIPYLLWDRRAKRQESRGERLAAE